MFVFILKFSHQQYYDSNFSDEENEDQNITWLA